MDKSFDVEKATGTPSIAQRSGSEEAPRPEEPDTSSNYQENGQLQELEEGARPPETPANNAEKPDNSTYSVFSSRTKIFIVAMTVTSSIFSPFSNFSYIPALNVLANDLDVSLAEINFTITSYQVLQGVAPLFFGDMADQTGRRPVYLLTFAIYLCAKLGLALQRNYAALIVLRALQSCGSSATIAVGNGVVADIATTAERGSYTGFGSTFVNLTMLCSAFFRATLTDLHKSVGWVQAGIQLAPALAPVLGGILAQFLGWPSIFWFLVIASALFIVLYALLVPETGRKIVSNGSVPARGVNRPFLSIFGPPKDKVVPIAKAARPKRQCVVPNPVPALLIVFEKDVGILLFFVSLLFTCFYCILVTFPDSLKRNYGFNELQVGFCYIPFSIGAVTGSVLFGKSMDWNFQRVARSIGVTPDRKRGNELRTFPIERARLNVIWGPTFVSAGTLIGWGWILASAVNLAVPLIVMFIAGACISGAMAMMSTLLVDLYPNSPATVMASLNISRCLLGAVGTAVIQYIIDAWGLGWTYTFLGLLVVASSPMLLVVLHWGPRWREERWLRLEEKEKKRVEKRKP